MLPTATLPTVLTGAAPSEAPLPNGVNPAENGEFEAILADKTAAAAPPLATLLELVGTADPAADDAETLPEGGKDLPDQSIDGSPTINPAILTLLTIPQASPAAPIQPALETPRGRGEVPAQAPVQPFPLLAPGKAEQPAQLPTLPPVPQVAATAVQQAAVTLRDGPRQAPPPRIAATLRLLTEAAADKAGVQPLDVGLAAPTATTPAQSVPFLTVPTASPASAPVATTPMAAPVSHDFAQLIDRLVAARESALPQAATVALAHADFGQVELRFAQDGGGLSVSLANADPDFARAVQAAVPPVAASSDSASAQGRQPGQSGPQAEQFGSQGHSHNSHRRDADDRGVRPNPGRPNSAEAASQSGIFA